MALTGKIALITGSAQGIGKAIAMRLAEDGADIVVSDVNLDAARETASEIEKLGRRALAVRCNVADWGEVQEMVKATTDAFERIDILVNNAGITRDKLMMRMDEKDWDDVLAINLKGGFLVTKAVTRVMMKQSYGRIVNVASIIGRIGNAGQANYAASKGGLIALTKSVAKEFASRNVTCNAVAPGFIETAMTDRLTDEVKSAYLANIPLGRFGTAGNVADAVRFLASDEAAYITGQVINIDGGMAP